MSFLLQVHLSAQVPLYIAQMKRYGGPVGPDLEDARNFALELGSKGDVLMYGGKKGEAAALANKLGRSVAVLSFCPGGVTTFGICFCAEHSPMGKAQEKGVCLECVAKSGPVEEVVCRDRARNVVMITARDRSR